MIKKGMIWFISILFCSVFWFLVFYSFIAHAQPAPTPVNNGGAVSDDAYGNDWDGDTETAPSKNALFDKIETISAGGGSVTINTTSPLTGAGTGSTFNLGLDQSLLTLSSIGGAVTDAQVPNNITITGLSGTNTGDQDISGKQNISSLETDVEALVDLQDLQGAVTDAQVPDNITISNLSGTNTGDQTTITGNAGTATALAANGANCSSGNAPLGVDASGAVESCFDVATQAELDAASSGAGGWTDGGTNVYVLTTTDNVGIGTVTPTAALLVENAGTQASFRVNDAVLDTTPFIVLSDGNVGIGTAFPLFPFQVTSNDSTAFTGSSFSTSNITVHNQNTTNNTAAMVNYIMNNSVGAVASAVRTAGVMTNHTSGSETADFVVVTRNAGTLAEKLRVKGSGNVGIGTVEPNGGLQVTNNFVRIGSGGTNTNAVSAGELYVQGDLEVDGTMYGNISGNAATVTTNANLSGEVTSSGNTTTIADSVTVTGWALGASTATTPAGGDNDTSLATTAYVQTEIAGLGSGGWTDGGTTVYPTTTTDNVGIGTFTPVSGAILTIKGTIAGADAGQPFAITDANVGIGTILPRSILEIQKGSGTAQITIDGTSGGCLMFQDTDGAGWTECDALNGTLSCSTDADGVCD